MIETNKERETIIKRVSLNYSNEQKEAILQNLIRIDVCKNNWTEKFIMIGFDLSLVLQELHGTND